MFPVLLLLTAPVLSAPVELTTLDGQSLAGELAGLSESGVTLEGQPPVGLGEVQSVRFVGVESRPVEEAERSLELRDGSRLAVDSAVRSGVQLTAKAGENEWTFAVTAVAAVRFAPAEEAVADAWRDLRNKPRRDDLLVVRKGDTLDFIPCVVGDITPEQLSVQARGRELTVPLTKVFAVLMADGPKGGRGNFGVHWADGSMVRCAGVALTESGLTLTTVAGPTITRPLSDVFEIDFAGGRIVRLDSITPRSVTYDDASPLFDEYVWKLRVGQNAVGTPLKVDGRERPSGLWIHSGTTAVFPMPRDGVRLQMTAGIDELDTPGNPVTLSVRGDGRALWTGEITPNESQRIDVEVDGVRQLTIEVTGDHELGVREHLALVSARILKEG